MPEPVVVGSILLGASEFVANYVRAKLGVSDSYTGGYEALGIVRDGVLVGGVVFHNYRRLPYGNSVEVSIAIDDPRGVKPGVIRAMCDYAFNHLGCVRATAMIAESNKRSRIGALKLGFTPEGTHPRAGDGRESAISYGMLREDCMWLKPRSEWKPRKRRIEKNG